MKQKDSSSKDLHAIRYQQNGKWIDHGNEATIWYIRFHFPTWNVFIQTSNDEIDPFRKP